MNNQRRVILDKTILKKLYLNIDFSNIGVGEERRLTDEVERLEIPFIKDNKIKIKIKPSCEIFVYF